MAEKIKAKLREYFALDYRSLAFMRFGIGFILLLDLILRAHSLSALYTDDGAFSRGDLVTLYGNRYFISLHMVSGQGWVVAVLFIIAGIFAATLMLGYHTTLSVIVSWFLLVSLQSRNPLVLHGGDIVLRVVLFWMMFLPIGARWSLDRLLNRVPKKEEQTACSPATVAYVVQIVLLYAMAGVLKSGVAWQNGTAVYYALSVDLLLRPLGGLLRKWYGITRFLTYTTHYFEIFGSALYFSPVATGLIRTIAICLYASMQIGFNLCLDLGLFGAISIVVTLGLLPPYFWDVWVARARDYFTQRARTGLTIQYDTSCVICYKLAHILREVLLLSPTTKLSPSDANQSVRERMDWVVIEDDGTTTRGFKGLATIVGYSPAFFWLKPLFALPGVRELGEYGYRRLAESRLAVCLPDPIAKESAGLFVRGGKIFGDAALIFLALYVIVWNADPHDKTGLLKGLSWIGWTTRLDQKFNLFAPTPLTEDGWYVIPATLRNGQEINLFQNGPMLTSKKLFPVSYAKPAHVAAGFQDQRWRKFMMNLFEETDSPYLLGYGRYLCRTWNATHTGGQTLETFHIQFMVETTTPPGVPQTPAVKTTLWNHHCF